MEKELEKKIIKFFIPRNERAREVGRYWNRRRRRMLRPRPPLKEKKRKVRRSAAIRGQPEKKRRNEWRLGDEFKRNGINISNVRSSWSFCSHIICFILKGKERKARSGPS